MNQKGEMGQAARARHPALEKARDNQKHHGAGGERDQIAHEAFQQH